MRMPRTSRKQSLPAFPLEDLSIERTDVVAWARRIKREAEKSGKDSLPGLQLLTLELSAHLLLNDRFRAVYCESIRKNRRIARGGFSRQDPENGGALFRSWGVVEIIPPHWDPYRGRFSLLAPFPIPVVFWGDDLSDIDEEASALNIRMLLDHRSETSNHVVYALACRRCGWLQGALGGPETFNSKVPEAKVQLRGLLLARWDPFDVLRSAKSDIAWPVFRRRKRDPNLAKLVEMFGEEVWGDDASRLESPPPRSHLRWPIGGDLSYLLDTALRPRSQSLANPTDPALRRQLQVLAWALRQVQCQVCRREGCIRFLTRFLLYLDSDASVRSQTLLIGTLHRGLRVARERTVKDPLLRSIFWIPGNIPDFSAQHIAGRLGRVVLTASERGHPKSAPARRIAIWLGSLARESEAVWKARLEDTLELPDEAMLEELKGLRHAVGVMVRDHTPGQVAGPISRLLGGSRFSRIGNLIIDYYTTVVWPRVPQRGAAKLRRRK